MTKASLCVNTDPESARRDIRPEGFFLCSLFFSLEQLVYSFPQATFATWWSNHVNWHSRSWWKIDD